jgi:hypothetical protein
VSGLFPQPKVNKPNPLPPAPERNADETAALAAEQRKKAARGGRAFTALTGGQGASENYSAVRFLGGAART